jgi:hypothetical protein
MLPPLVRYARPASEPPLAVPGRYDPELGLRVRDTSLGPVPVIAEAGELELVTKTKAQLEGDDDRQSIMVITKTDSREHDDVDPPTRCDGGDERRAQRILLEIVTKTFNQRERDDEGPKVR